MEPTKPNNPISTKNSESYNIRDFLDRYLKHWKWFLLSAVICLALAFLYLRYTPPQYASFATIMLLEDKASSPEAAVFRDLDVFSDKSRKVEDEIQIMKSRKLMTNVVKRLKLNFQYFTEGRVHRMEIYSNQPIKLNFFVSDSVINLSKVTFNIDIKTNNNFIFWEEDSDEKKDVAFGEKFGSPLGDIIITPSNNIERYIGSTIEVVINPVDKVAQNLQNSVLIHPSEEGSNVIHIMLDNTVRAKARDIINTLIEEYNNNSIDEKSLVSKNTAEFINSRIDLIATDLADVDNTAERFKTGNRLTNIASEADIYLTTGSQNEQELISVGTELSMVNFMKETVGSQESYDLVPSNVGLSDPSITNISAKYNELVMERQRLLKSSNEKNPVVVNLDQQLNGLKQSMKQSLGNLSNTLDLKVNNLKNQAARINSRISSVPGQEREFRDITRQQQIKESLYLYLLQKREESAIATATTSPNAKIIDTAYSKNDAPVSPKKKMVYLAAFLLGLAIPFSIIYTKDLLDTKIHNKEDLEKEISGIPILAEIPSVDDNKELTIQPNDRSILAESFRILRTNLDYFIRSGSNTKNNKIIFVTSTINGEGKSFVAFNLALTLAYSNKRVILVGGDIRNPGLNLYMEGAPAEKGLTEYLSEKLKEREVIFQFSTDENSIDVIYSGKIPPNPAELLMSDKLDSLFSYLNDEYDYVVVDTAPSMLVTDTLLISKYAHHTIYVTRANYTEKKMLNFVSETFNDNKLNGMLMVVNDVDSANFGYGAKYGYGYYGSTKKKKFSLKKVTKQ